MFHLLANAGSVAETTDTDLAPVTDSVILIQNSHWVLQQDMSLFAVAAMEPTPSRVRISTPSLRIPSTPWIRPLIVGAIPPDKCPIADYRANPLTLKSLEEIEYLVTSALASGSEEATILSWIGDAIVQPPVGIITTMRGTSTTAAVANKWSAITMTWQDTLPYGTYGIVGLQHESANGQACRLIINGQQFRPGAMSVTALGNSGPPMFLKGGLGLWGTFRSTAMPLVEVLCNGADASHEVYLEFVRMG